MSKGSKQRPTDHNKFSSGWDKIFGEPKGVVIASKEYMDNLESMGYVEDTVESLRPDIEKRFDTWVANGAKQV